MAFDLKRFLRRADPIHIATYCDQREYKAPVPFHWADPPEKWFEAFLTAMQNLPDNAQRQLYADFARVNALANDRGDIAMIALVNVKLTVDKFATFRALSDASSRALWLFMHYPTVFQRAEETYEATTGVNGRSWSGWRSPVSPSVDRAIAPNETFLDALRGVFRQDGVGRRVVVEAFTRSNTTPKDKDEVVQFSIYVEAMPETVTVFEKDESHVKPRVLRRALEASLIYTPATGAIDVIARGGKKSRQELALAFVEHVLGASDEELADMPLRQFDLQPLMQPITFPTDDEDGIRSVKLTRLLIAPDNHAHGKITLDVSRNGDLTLQQTSEHWFCENDPLKSGFVPVQARITVEFELSEGRGRAKVQHIEITAPNRCNLNDQTERERVLGEKYLKRWGLVAEA